MTVPLHRPRRPARAGALQTGPEPGVLLSPRRRAAPPGAARTLCRLAGPLMVAGVLALTGTIYSPASLVSVCQVYAGTTKRLVSHVL